MPAAVLVGRRLTIDALRSAVDAAMAGAGGVVLLAGEAGMGKTALAAEAAAYAKARGAVAVWGTCWEGEGAPGYWPWIQVVRVPRAVGDVPARRLARLPGDVVDLLAIAAVAGTRFAIAAVAGIAGLPAEDAVPLVDSAVRAGVVEQDSPGGARFSHDLAAEHDALIGELARATGLGGRRRRLGHAAGRSRFGIDTLDMHLCVAREDGLTVFDACPAKAVYEEFTTGDMFREAVSAAGLPAPRIEGLGDVQVAHLRQELRP